MKPIKNHYYCIGANRAKMLFESKSKADNFIRYNSEEILEETGKAPVRSYYCTFCCGWHVTSMESEEQGKLIEARDEIRMAKLIELRAMRIQKQSGKVVKRLQPCMFTHVQKPVCMKIDRMMQKLFNYREPDRIDENAFAEAREMLEFCRTEVFPMGEMIKNRETRDLIEKKEERLSVVVPLMEGYLIYRELVQSPSLRSWISLYDEIVGCNSCYRMDTLLEEVHGMRKNVTAFSTRLYQATWKRLSVSLSSLEMVANKGKKRVSPLRGKTLVETNSEEYRRMLITLIDLLPQVQMAYDSGNIQKCENLVGKGLGQLCFFSDDANVSKVRKYYMKWKEMLQSIETCA